MKVTRTRVSVFIAISLDGFIARPDGDVAWLHEVEPIAGGGDAGYGAFFDSIDVLVLGRGSFEKVLEFEWPYGTKPVIVLSKSQTEVPEALRGQVRIDESAPLELVDRVSGGRQCVPRADEPARMALDAVKDQHRTACWRGGHVRSDRRYVPVRQFQPLGAQIPPGVGRPRQMEAVEGAIRI